jgi:magnesium chelatase family protein
MLEFSRRVLEVLRQPLEEGTVAVARAARTVVFPARFMLVGAMNPCPCGFLGDTVRVCRCTPVQISSYHDRLSGPLRDRLDLTVEVPALPPEALGSVEAGESSAAVRARVAVARSRQSARYEADCMRTNAELTARLMPMHAQPNAAGLRVLSTAVSRLGLSARGYDRIRKVARTIADLGGHDDIGADEVAEALQFRMIVR